MLHATILLYKFSTNSPKNRNRKTEKKENKKLIPSGVCNGNYKHQHKNIFHYNLEII